MNYSIILNSNNRVDTTTTSNDATYNFDWSVLESGEYKVSWNLNIPSSVVVSLTAFQTLLANKPPWGQYSASSWSGTTLTDLTTNGRNATTSGVSLGTTTGNGATGTITSLAGGITNTILWPAGSIASSYTICGLTRYTTTNTTNQQRTLCSSTNNWLQGHWANKRGVAFNASSWRTQSTTSTGTLLNWLNSCATSSSTGPNNILMDGVGVGLNVGGNGVVSPLSINLCQGGETSDFEFSQLIIWDQVLTDTELLVVSTALNTYLSTGVLQ